jgi:predicted metal-binding membrane protein
MRDQSQVELLLRRDRLIVAASLAAITLIAWIYVTREARAMADSGVCRCLGMNMSGPDTRAWAPLQLVPLFLMWAEMMVAMMIPSAAPMILMFAALNRKRRELERPFVPTGIFLLGYLTVWTGFSALAAIAQWILHGAALLSPLMVGTSPVFGGILLMAAGIFQWTPLKHVCLRHCRSPLDFFTSDWREGRCGAWIMGIRHGAYCAGCCWILMALLFVAGVMNLWWIALISIFVLLEKIVPRGFFWGQIFGALLVVWGGWMICAGRGIVFQ